jgi:flagellar motor switch protein FliN
MADEIETPETDETESADEAGSAVEMADTLDEFETPEPEAEGAELAGTEGELLKPGEEADEVTHGADDLEAIYDVPVQLSAVLGRSTMQVSQLLKLGRGAVVELDRKVGEAIDIFVNNRLVARGEVVVVEDRLGVTMTEIIKADRAG